MARRYSAWALTFDKGLGYLETKGLVSGLCASTKPAGSSLAIDANPFASCATKTELFIFSEWSIGHSEKIKKFSFGGNTEMRYELKAASGGHDTLGPSTSSELHLLGLSLCGNHWLSGEATQ